MNTKILTKLSIGLVCLVAVATAFFFMKQGSTDTNVVASTNKQGNENKKQSSSSCKPQKDKSWAYQIEATVKATAKNPSVNKTIYQSKLNFTLDLSEQSQQVKGLASRIQVKENGQPDKTLLDVPFLAFNQSNEFAQFSFFDDLGLGANHPMKLLNPLVKNLSVAASGNNAVYSYDALDATYAYTHHFPQVQRKMTGGLHQGSTQDSWQAVLSDDCLLESLQASESLPFKLGTAGAVIVYDFKAKRIPSSRSLDAVTYTTSANYDNSWENAVIADTELSPPISSDASMWQAFQNFSKNKSTGQLKKAAEYLMKNHTPDQLATMLNNPNLSEASKRDLAFALSLVEGAQAQDYILDTLSALPVKTDAQGDVQKVRLMVALTGRSDINEGSFNRLMNLRNNPDASNNVKNNVLISGGKIAQDLAKTGQTQPISSFETAVKTQLQSYDDNAASAILASGNAELDLNSQLVDQLNKGTEKSRYAAASVLVRDGINYDLLIDHLNNEQSDIVFYTIVSGLAKSKLNGNQKAKLSNLMTVLQQKSQTETNKEKITLLNRLVT